MANISIIGWFTKYYFGNSNSNDLYGSDLYGDRMYGRGGDDTFHSSLGPDYFNGGTGFDTVDYSGSDFAVDVRLYRGKGYGGDAQGDTYYGIEGLVGSDYDDRLHGNFANNTLDGGDGDDSLYGYSGNDTLIGSKGNDYLNGGTGFDTVDYSTVSYNLFVDLELGRSSYFIELNQTYYSSIDTLNNIEKVIGSDSKDVFTGKDGANNMLYGRGGEDYFWSSTGGNHYDGGADIDKVAYNFSNAAVDVDLLTGTGGGGDAAGDSYTSIENINGSQFNDELFGNDSNNIIIGESGDDKLVGRRGNRHSLGKRRQRHIHLCNWRW